MVKENLKTDIRGLKRDRFHQLQDSQLSHYTLGVNKRNQGRPKYRKNQQQVKTK